MAAMLPAGVRLYCTALSSPLEVVRLLGAGGQGEVHEVRLAGESHALKWYYPSVVRRDPGLAQRLADSIRASAPSRHFLWPIALVEPEPACRRSLGLGDTGFGYLMPMRSAQAVPATEHYAGRLSLGLRQLLRACFHLSEAFQSLHSKGLCYKDISLGNVFLLPASGEVLICDNDNVEVNGLNRGLALGTPGFMAPEVLLGQSKPSSASDLFSLAVLMFALLTRSDPLKGRLELQIRCLDMAARRRLYAEDPVFVFDPENPRNRPDPILHQAALRTWPIYPLELQQLFQRTFGAGLRHPERRVLCGEWLQVLAATLDCQLLCPHCGQEVFGDCAAGRRCWDCGGPIPASPRLRIGDRSVLVQPGNELHRPHFDRLRIESLEAPLARVEHHPRQPDLLGLLNLSDQVWVAQLDDGLRVPLPPGQRGSLRRIRVLETPWGLVHVMHPRQADAGPVEAPVTA
ncbi:MAG: protein kinase domain-containing protein [Synechococcaceae cyanobacterium]